MNRRNQRSEVWDEIWVVINMAIPLMAVVMDMTPFRPWARTSDVCLARAQRRHTQADEYLGCLFKGYGSDRIE